VVVVEVDMVAASRLLPRDADEEKLAMGTVRKSSPGIAQSEGGLSPRWAMSSVCRRRGWGMKRRKTTKRVKGKRFGTVGPLVVAGCRVGCGR